MNTTSKQNMTIIVFISLVCLLLIGPAFTSTAKAGCPEGKGYCLKCFPQDRTYYRKASGLGDITDVKGTITVGENYLIGDDDFYVVHEHEWEFDPGNYIPEIVLSREDGENKFHYGIALWADGHQVWHSDYHGNHAVDEGDVLTYHITYCDVVPGYLLFHLEDLTDGWSYDDSYDPSHMSLSADSLKPSSEFNYSDDGDITSDFLYATEEFICTEVYVTDSLEWKAPMEDGTYERYSPLVPDYPYVWVASWTNASYQIVSEHACWDEPNIVDRITIQVDLQGSNRPDSGWEVPLAVGFFPPYTDNQDILYRTIKYLTFENQASLENTPNGKRAQLIVGPVRGPSCDISADSETTLLNVKRAVSLN